MYTTYLLVLGFQFSNMRSWRLHWDHQLYKALEFQYQSGLQNLNQHLTDIPVELVYRSACSLFFFFNNS